MEKNILLLSSESPKRVLSKWCNSDTFYIRCSLHYALCKDKICYVWGAATSLTILIHHDRGVWQIRSWQWIQPDLIMWKHECARDVSRGTGLYISTPYILTRLLEKCQEFKLSINKVLFQHYIFRGHIGRWLWILHRMLKVWSRGTLIYSLSWIYVTACIKFNEN